MVKEPASADESIYRNAKSTRPAWANALIVAGVLVLAWLLAGFLGGFNLMSWFLLLAAVVIAIVGGVLALTRIGSKN